MEQVEKHPADIAKTAADHFKITRQAVNKHLQRLTAEKSLAEAGNTRSRTYKLCPLSEWTRKYPIHSQLAEDVVWRNDIQSVLGKLPDNVLSIWHYGFTEMFNNAIDHSGGTSIVVHITKTASAAEIVVVDDGVGIFQKIRQAMNLLDERHAILELSKGKLTTDPKGHTGQGIFFTSRMVDSFDIISHGVHFSHQFGKAVTQGTGVWMKLNNRTSRTAKKIFDQYSSADDDYGFTRTVVPVRLAQYGNDQLISRSQSKRLLARVELFKIVILDFEGVQTIGPAFADEIFRVFAREHPEIQLLYTKANSEVKRLIERARAGAAGESPTSSESQK
ncbi:MAG: STAS-like domain-containing protein [Burkholderiales bacterium]